MDQDPQHPLNTREFVALWNVAKGEHLVQRLGAALARLVERGVLPPLSQAQTDIVAHAVQLAGDPAAGPTVALEYLETLGGTAPGGSAGG